MKNSINHKKVLLVCLAFALALVSVLVAGLFLSSHQEKRQHDFPQWEVAGEAPQTQEGLTLSLDRVERSLPASGESTDSVFLLLEKKGDTTCGPNYWVDYLCEDTWYTVYEGNVQAEYAQVLGGGAGTITLEYTVPRGLFQAAGSYRLCVDGLGTVPIDISAPVT